MYVKMIIGLLALLVIGHYLYEKYEEFRLHKALTAEHDQREEADDKLAKNDGDEISLDDKWMEDDPAAAGPED